LPSKNPAQRLRDIIDNIDAIEAFTVQLDSPAFRMDRKTVYAVVRALENWMLVVAMSTLRTPWPLTPSSMSRQGCACDAEPGL
jgi:hypothetical protein